ncbi:uncharacterized protein J4E88_007983 [Alternaria novae-zelandiae]|uniref:uncharacterized protein n=1 Tax=Alternaria novae-zelandiae TaxID=430562 RepID=UPI0020C5429A|nr:uncharacterized protein J4E88_007983 [Alternaria novae-zelandiae]KAI4675079.1 hypothetical protein J4E88_007983 [Alternaria novae-zelandiae]
MESAAPAKRQWKGRTDEQKAERAKKRQEQKSGLNARQARTSTGKKPTKVQRVFSKLDEWKPEELGFIAGIKEIEFGPDFVVQDAHLDAIATADEAFRTKLEKFGLGARLGKTNMPVTDDAVVRLARACPNLKTLRLDSALLITGTCIPPILTACPNITSLCITGHNGRTGSLKLDNLKPLADDPVISASAPKLKNLDLRRAINAAQENFSDVLRAITRPPGRKNKLEVQFQHPTVHWEKVYKNGMVKQPRITQAMKEQEMLEEVMWAVKGNRGFDIDDEDDGYGTDYSAISAIIHGAM